MTMPFFDAEWSMVTPDLPDEPPSPLVHTMQSQGHGEIALALSKKDFDWLRDQLLLATDPIAAAFKILIALEGQAAEQQVAGYTEALQKTSDVFLTRRALLESMPPDSSEN